VILENIDEYQPRFRAWLRSLSAKEGDVVKTYEYIIWVSRKASEFKRVDGVTFLNAEGHLKFTEWLFEEVARK
jgi:hypothetical protein